VPDIKDLLEKLDNLSHKFHKLAKASLTKTQLALAQKAKRLISPKAILLQMVQRLDMASQRLEKSMLRGLQKAKDSLAPAHGRFQKAIQMRLHLGAERFRVATAKLDALSPLKVMSRGYSAVLKAGKAVAHAAQVQVGDPLQVRLSDGILDVEVKEKHGI
jgi:exodeoxyribonuclease VII large subunit